MQKHLQSIPQIGELSSSLKRQAILVLGMHRSGTSALGGVLSVLGAAGPKTLMPPNEYNPRGYFESSPLVTAHDELMSSAGSCWHDWRQLNPLWIQSKAAGQHRHKIKTILIDEFGSEPLIFVKDPRICRFVPFISSILAELNINPVAFLPLRNPLEIAYSLKRRDEIALPKSLLLWLRHVLEAEYHSRHMPRCFLSYEGLLIDWRYHLDRAAEKTGVIWPARSDRSNVKIDRFLAPELFHEKTSSDEIKNHPMITSMVRETYNVLTNIVANGENQELLDRLDSVRTRFNEGCEIFGAAVAAEELRVEQLRGKLNESNVEAQQLRQENSKLTVYSEHRSLEVSGLVDERDSLVRVQIDLITERDALARTNSELFAERDTVARAHSDLIAERDALARTNGDLVAERDALAGTNSDLVAERDALACNQSDLIAERDAFAQAHSDLTIRHNTLACDRDSVVAKRDLLLASRSWRLTAPLRRIRQLFARQQ